MVIYRVGRISNKCIRRVKVIDKYNRREIYIFGKMPSVVSRHPTIYNQVKNLLSYLRRDLFFSKKEQNLKTQSVEQRTFTIQ